MSESVKTTIINPPNLYDPSSNGYSHAVVATGASATAYIAGQGGEAKNGHLSPSFEDQVKQAYCNLQSVLESLEAEPQQVTKLTTYVVNYDPSKLEIMTKTLVAMFGDALPAQTLVPVPRLALDGMLFEVDAVAVLSEYNQSPSTA
ncbi:RidA family protein [Rubritalea marina]|uniref:RidA family protein n=1 Tax=Rubritalea marina TaxID=361055 RepID=UPI00036FC48F|nr:RidA family protein [Rubritalea marina]